MEDRGQRIEYKGLTNFVNRRVELPQPAEHLCVDLVGSRVVRIEFDCSLQCFLARF